MLRGAYQQEVIKSWNISGLASSPMWTITPKVGKPQSYAHIEVQKFCEMLKEAGVTPVGDS